MRLQLLPRLNTHTSYVLPKQTGTAALELSRSSIRKKGMQSLLTSFSLEVGLTSQGNHDLVAFEARQAIRALG